MRQRRPRPIVRGDIALVPLSRGGHAIVDAPDAELLSGRAWRIDAQGYVVCSLKRDGRKAGLLLHSLLIDVPDDMTADHIDGDRLNNRRANLRPATALQQQHNTPRRRDNSSGFKGVGRYKARWRARIMVKGRRIHLGSFDTPEDAGRAYDAAAREHFGEYARVNFPEISA